MNGVKMTAMGASLMIFVGVAAADEIILFDTMGPGNSYDPNNGTTIVADSGWHEESGFKFTNDTEDNILLTKLQHGIMYNFGVNAITLSVHESAGGLPGNVLETVEVTNLPDVGMQSSQTVNFSGTTLLEAGEEYMITAAGPSGGGFHMWGHNTQGFTGGVVLKAFEGGPWFDAPASNITPAVTVTGIIPAPSALALLGVAGLASGRRRRQ